MHKATKIIILTGATLLYLVAVYDNWYLNEIAVRGTKGAYPLWQGVLSSLINPLIGLLGLFLVPVVMNKGRVARVVVGIILLPATLTYGGQIIRVARNVIRAGSFGFENWHWWGIKLVALSILGTALTIFAYITLFRAKRHERSI